MADHRQTLLAQFEWLPLAGWGAWMLFLLAIVAAVIVVAIVVGALASRRRK